MKAKLKKVALLLLGAAAVAVFLVLGESQLSLSEIDLGAIDWNALIKESLAPKMVEALTLIFGTYVASSKSREKMNGASEDFKQATDAANTSAQAANASAELNKKAYEEMGAFREQLLERVEALEKRHTESTAILREESRKTATEVSKTVDVLRMAFGSTEELVKNGKAGEILALLEGDDGKENA